MQVDGLLSGENAGEFLHPALQLHLLSAQLILLDLEKEVRQYCTGSQPGSSLFLLFETMYYSKRGGREYKLF